MKKTLAFILAILMGIVLCVTFTACDDSAESEGSDYDQLYESDDEEYEDEEYEDEDYEDDEEEEKQDLKEEEENKAAGNDVKPATGDGAASQGDGNNRYSGKYLTGMAGGEDDSLFAVCLFVDPNGKDCLLAYGNPGQSATITGLVKSEGDLFTITPSDGSDEILIFMTDEPDGSIFIEFINDNDEVLYDGSLNEVDYEEFKKHYGMIG